MIVLDTSALIWAISGDDHEERARIEAIEKVGGPVALPAPALAEFLTKVDTKDRNRVVAELSRFLQILPFDHHTARVTADLFRKPRPKKATKQAFKIDAMIYGVAVAQRAKSFLHCDSGFESLAGTSPPVPLVNVRKMKLQNDLPLRAEEPE